MLPEITRSGFDLLMHRNTLNDRPGQPGGFDGLDAFADLVNGPYLSVRNLVQRGNDARCPRLPDVRQRYGVDGAGRRIAKPTPCLF